MGVAGVAVGAIHDRTAGRRIPARIVTNIRKMIDARTTVAAPGPSQYCFDKL